MSSLCGFLQMMYGRTDKLVLDYHRYSYDHLLSLSDIISEEMMCKPDILDTKDGTYLHVIKNGIASGVTIGRATGMFSFVRDEVTGQVSKEWAIYNFHRDRKITEFSAPGDSGSIIVDGLGRIGGLLTGGTGKAEAIDVTYATPMWWLWPRIKKHFPNAHLYPTTMADDTGELFHFILPLQPHHNVSITQARYCEALARSFALGREEAMRDRAKQSPINISRHQHGLLSKRERA